MQKMKASAFWKTFCLIQFGPGAAASQRHLKDIKQREAKKRALPLETEPWSTARIWDLVLCPVSHQRSDSHQNGCTRYQIETSIGHLCVFVGGERWVSVTWHASAAFQRWSRVFLANAGALQRLCSRDQQVETVWWDHTYLGLDRRSFRSLQLLLTALAGCGTDPGLWEGPRSAGPKRKQQQETDQQRWLDWSACLLNKQDSCREMYTDAYKHTHAGTRCVTLWFSISPVLPHMVVAEHPGPLNPTNALPFLGLCVFSDELPITNLAYNIL